MKFTEAVEKFGEYQKNILGRSDNTIKSYRMDIMKFSEGTGCEDVESVTKKDAEAYFSELAKSTSASTRCRKISAIQMLYGWLVNEEIVRDDPVRNLAKPKIPQRKVKAMNQEEVHKVLAVAKGRNVRSQDYFRNLTIINLMFATGLRRNELVNIQLEDVNISENSLLVRVGKGNKQRVVYYNDTTKALLSEWIASHRKLYSYAEESEYLFVTRKAPQMCVKSVNDIVNGLFQEAGEKDKGYTAHSTRKAFATTVYDVTKDIVTVQNLLGHSSPQTTMHYVMVAEETKKKAAQLVNF